MVAAFSKPAKLALWNTGLGNQSEPSAAKKVLGHLFAAIPSSSEENWRAYTQLQFQQWLNERIFDGTDENELDFYDPGTGESALRFGGNKLALFPLNAAIDPRVDFDADDYMEFDRTLNELAIFVANTERFRITPNEVTFADPNFSMDFGVEPELRFDVDDRFKFDRAANQYIWDVGGVAFAWLGVGGNAQFATGGVRVVNRHAAPVVDRFEMSKNNVATARVRVSSGGAIIGARTWNVSSVNRTGNGAYDVILNDKMTDVDGMVLAAIGQTERIVAQSFVNGGGDIEVVTESLATNNPADGTFKLIGFD